MSDHIGSRVEATRVRQMRTLLNTTRVFAALVSLSAFVLVVMAVDPTIWNFQSFLWGLKFFIFLIEVLFLLVGYAIALLMGLGDGGAAAIMASIHNAIFGGNETIMGIPFDELLANPAQIPTEQNIVDALYAFLMMTILIIALIASIGFIRECNPALSATSFFALNIVLGLASLNGKLVIDLSLAGSTFFQLIFSRLVLTAFFIYFALELSFQAGYIYNVIGPNIERNRRISANIKRLKQFQMPIGQQRASEGEGSQVRGKNTSRARIAVTTAISQVKGLLGKKIFRISPEEDWDKMNNRLKTFYLSLEENDPLISVSLSASTYTPSIMRLALIITSGTIFRMGALLLLSWLALNPEPILVFLNMPESVINSVEAGQPEMVLFVLAPLAVTFFMLGLLIQWIQKLIATRGDKSAKIAKAMRSVNEDVEKERIPFET
ncbi:MAG: hypothetical protein ACTSO7_13220 [Candidatus Heimdallarchaeota archaeon]